MQHPIDEYGPADMGIATLLFWTLLLIGIVGVIRFSARSATPPTRPPDCLRHTHSHQNECWPTASSVARSTKPNLSNTSRSPEINYSLKQVSASISQASRRLNRIRPARTYVRKELRR